MKIVVALAVALGALFVAAPVASAETQFDLGITSAPQDYGDPNAIGDPAEREGTCPYLVVCASASKTYCKNPANTKGTYSRAGGSFVIGIEPYYFCHRGARVTKLKWRYYQDITGTLSILYREGGVYTYGYWYNWRGHGRLSGYIVGVKAKFKGCLDPGSKQICNQTIWGEKRLYFHEDGTRHYGRVKWWEPHTRGTFGYELYGSAAKTLIGYGGSTFNYTPSIGYGT